MFNIFSQQGNSNSNYFELRKQVTRHAGEDVGKGNTNSLCVRGEGGGEMQTGKATMEVSVVVRSLKIVLPSRLAGSLLGM